MPGREVDRAIEGLARRQHGAFHRRQALQLGATPAMIRHRLTVSAWVRMAGSDVYALPSHRGTWLRQCMAATLSVPDAAISGPSAAALHGFPGWPCGRLEVVVPSRRRPSPFAVVRANNRVRRVVRVEGVPALSPADTVADLAARVDHVRLGSTVDDAVAAGILDLDELRAFRDARQPGVGRLRAVLDERGDGWVAPASELERHLRAVLFTTPGLPAVQWQAPGPWWDRAPGRVDAVVADWRLIVEADGRRWHTRVADFDRDRWRDNQAAAHGYGVVRFTWAHLRDDLAGCRALLAACRARAAA